MVSGWPSVACSRSRAASDLSRKLFLRSHGAARQQPCARLHGAARGRPRVPPRAASALASRLNTGKGGERSPPRWSPSTTRTARSFLSAPRTRSALNDPWPRSTSVQRAEARPSRPVARDDLPVPHSGPVASSLGDAREIRQSGPTAWRAQGRPPSVPRRASLMVPALAALARARRRAPPDRRFRTCRSPMRSR